MKKRILALALAGTTAFSVFGAAMSANAAVISSQKITNNDAYKSYAPIAYSIVSSYKGAVTTNYVIDANTTTSIKTVKIDANANNHAVYADANTAYKNVDEYIFANYNVAEEYDRNDYYKISNNTNRTFTIKKNPTTGAVTITNTQGNLAGSAGTAAINTAFGNDFTADNQTVTFNPTTDFANGEKGYTFNGTDSLTFDQLVTKMTEVFNTNGYTQLAKAAAVEYIAGKNYWNNNSQILAVPLTALPTDTLDSVKANITATSNTNPASNGLIKVNGKKAYGNAKGGDPNWTFNGSMSADTVIYPWTTTTVYATVDGKTVTVDQAVSNPTVYLLDFIPKNSTTASASDIANAYNYNTDKTKAATLIGQLTDATAWERETGYGTSYGVRAEVIADYEEFLSELVLLQRYGDRTVSKAAFKSEYEDRKVSGYYYDPYTGLSTNVRWEEDLYNIDTLLEDIYASSENNHYKDMNTSNLMYLMQQYDKYIGYIEKAEVEKDAWGDLLVSILENVTAEDFKKATDYKTFARKAEDLIADYEDATTSSLVKAAEEAMYNLIVSEQVKTAGAADEKKALNADLYSLYFNAKTTAATYTTANAVADATKANLTNYSYLAGVTLLKKTDAAGTTLTSTLVTTPGYYTLYPIADYYEYGNAVKKYAGVTGTAPAEYATDEYEWFWNVYALAKEVNGTNKALSGVVSAVNDALNDAVAGLEVTKPATATAESALDEMIEHYEEVLDFYVTGNGVNEEDFNATYYAAYQAALAYADVAEGAAQVANARYMVEVAAKALTYQGAQATVSKNDIKTVEAAIKEGNTALKTIKEDKNYNAAQVTALNKAIATAQDIVDIYNGKVPAYNSINTSKVASIGDKDGIVKSDITGAIDAIETAIKGSTVVQGWYNNGTAWQYGEGDNYLNDGWHFIDKVWYYFDEDATAKQSEWLNLDGKWYWFNSNCGAAIGWAKVDNEWYYFGGDNAMKTGWVKVDGNWYYLAASGKMTTGWVQVDGKWYYMSKESNSLGQMLANTTVEGYKLGADGAMIEK